MPTWIAAANVVFDFTVDRSAVPAVNFKKMTFKVNVGNCTGCSVLEDLVPIAATYKAATGECIFNSTGTNLQVTGLNYIGGASGVCTKATLYNDKKWAYSFTFDDSRPQVESVAKPFFDSLGFRGGVSLNTGSMTESTPGWNMSWQQLDTLYAAGWTVSNHTVGHIAITNANIATQLDPVKAAVEARYPGFLMTHVVYPFNDDNEWDATRNAGYLSAESQEGDNYVDVFPIQVVPGSGYVTPATAAGPADAQWLIGRQQAYGTNLALFNSWADNAAADARPRWLVAFTHAVESGSSAPGTYDTNEVTLNSHLQYVYNNWGTGGDKSLWFAPSDEVMNYLVVRENCACNAVGSPTVSPTQSPSFTVSPTFSVSPTVTPTPTLTPTPCGLLTQVRVNVGGSSFTDSLGDSWSADQAYTPGGWGYATGTQDISALPVAGTVDDVLYQTERWGNPADLIYRFDVPNGDYQVRMLLNEVFFTNPGDRVFNVLFEGAVLINNLDLVVQAGTNVAWETTVMVTVNDGTLDIVGVASANRAKFSAIEITRLLPCPSATPSYTQAASATPSFSATFTLSETPTKTSSALPSSTLSASPTLSKTQSHTRTWTTTTTRTPSFSVTKTPSPLLSFTPTFTESPPFTATLTFSAGPSATLTLSPTLTATLANSAVPSPTLTETPTNLAVPSSTRTATPANSAVSSATLTVTLTNSVVPSVTATVTLSLTPGAVFSATQTSIVSTLVSTPSSVALEILDLQAAPNPDPQFFSIELQGQAEDFEIRVYTASRYRVRTWVLPAAAHEGWQNLPIPADFLLNLPRGIYHYSVTARVGDKRVRRVGSFYVLKK